MRDSQLHLEVSHTMFPPWWMIAANSLIEVVSIASDRKPESRLPSWEPCNTKSVTIKTNIILVSIFASGR